MKFKNPLLVVSDMEKSKTFYKDVLGLRVIMDFGANVTLTGGLCLQTKESWMGFIGAKEDEVVFGGNNAEIYFEEDDFDAFAEKLKDLKYINYVHPVIEHRWGQRVVRFYDPDRHIIEVGENIKMVCRRFLDSGMTEEEVAVRMDVPLKFVQACKK
ncbi:MAG: VOC family protein [Anaerotignum sp.]|nr:VOC family protein [Anaerotignum sp.]